MREKSYIAPRVSGGLVPRIPGQMGVLPLAVSRLSALAARQPATPQYTRPFPASPLPGDARRMEKAHCVTFQETDGFESSWMEPASSCMALGLATNRSATSRSFLLPLDAFPV